MTKKERVKRAIEFRHPDQLPIRLASMPAESDMVIFGVQTAADWTQSDPTADEWGCRWQNLGIGCGQVVGHPLEDWSAWESGYRIPDPNAAGRLDRLQELISQYSDWYIGCTLEGVSGFNRLMFLRGFDNILVDPLLEPERFAALADAVFDFENQLIRRLTDTGVDCICLYDDWGTQHGLMMSPTHVRQFYKERYRRQFALIHECGMHVYLHSCGNVWEMIPDMIEIGVDVLNLEQLNLFGIERIADLCRGKVCLHSGVDSQTTLIHGTLAEIREEARRVVSTIHRAEGGLIVYGDVTRDHGYVPEERIDAMIETFQAEIVKTKMA